MQHTDFTKYTIFSADGDGSIKVTRVDPADHRCECCMGPAEYELHSSWDPLGMCTVYECQSCMINNNAGYDSPDVYVLIN